MSEGRKRARTLRIPDDEVARPERVSAPPEPPPPPTPPPPPPEPEAAVVQPTRIISINAPPSEAPVPPVEIPKSAPAPKVQGEDSWTPFQPTVADEPVIPIEAEAPRPSDSAPESLEPIDDAVISEPAPVPPQRVLAPTEPEGEEVNFDDDAPVAAAAPAPTSSAPVITVTAPVENERLSDPGAEIGVEDVVVVESAPPPKGVAVLPPMRPKLSSQPHLPPPKKITAPKLAKPPLVIVPPHMGTVAPQSSESAEKRRKGRLWWEDLFNDDYLRTCEKLSDAQIAKEVDFIEDSLSIEKGGAVLDLACGTGRHAIELATRGYEVVGFDLSLAMLARAGDDAQDREAKLNFIQGDMREMTFDEQFDGVVCWNTSFGYFEEEKNALVVDKIHRSLKAEGLLLLDVVNRDFLVRQSPSLAWFEGDGCVCMDEMNVDFITSRLKVKRTIMLDDGRSRETEYSMRVYSLHELGRILHEHGFKVCEVSGRTATPGVYFGNESPRTLILAEKR